MLPLPARPRAQPKLRVIIADDRPRTRRALRALFTTYAGYEVVGEASDGNEAVERVEQLRPDLVLLDVRMSLMDGIAATRRIKTQRPAVRVIVHSLAVERREETIAAGADAFVLKGGRPDELRSALSALRP